MTSYQIANHIIQFSFSMLVWFFMFSFMIHASFLLFRIRNHRIRSTIRLLLPLKFSLAPFYFLIPNQWVWVNANIFGCSHPIQSFLYKSILKNEGTTLGINCVITKFLEQFPNQLVWITIFAFISVSVIRVAAIIFQYFSNRKQISIVQKNSTIGMRPIANLSLAKQLKKINATIHFSNKNTIPFAGLNNQIIVPENLIEKLSQNEYETIIAHELEHLKWHDTFFRFFGQVIAAIYWWVPLKEWLKKTEHEQELACDYSIYQYEYKGSDLAQALQKSLNNQSLIPTGYAAFVKEKGLTAKQMILERFSSVLFPVEIETFITLKTVISTGLITLFIISIGIIIC